VVASRQANQPNITARDGEVAREDCTILTNSAEIRRQPVDDIEKVVNARSASIADSIGIFACCRWRSG